MGVQAASLTLHLSRREREMDTPRAARNRRACGRPLPPGASGPRPSTQRVGSGPTGLGGQWDRVPRHLLGHLGGCKGRRGATPGELGQVWPSEMGGNRTGGQAEGQRPGGRGLVVAEAGALQCVPRP